MSWFARRSTGNAEGRPVTHVDVVKNEWLAGFQVVVARVCDDGGTVQIKAAKPEWEALIEKYRDAEASSDAFIGGLHEHLHGDYLFATEPHDETECPFHGDVILPLVSAEPGRQADRV